MPTSELPPSSPNHNTPSLYPTIRLATADDASGIASIFQQSISADDSTMVEGEFTTSSAVELLNNQHEREETWVALDRTTVIAWGQIRRYSPRSGYRYAAETSIFLRREHRGRGIGAHLQRHLMLRAKDLRYHHLVARVFADNIASVRLHTKLGYEVVGRQREIGFKKDRWQDILVLQYITT